MLFRTVPVQQYSGAEVATEDIVPSLVACYTTGKHPKECYPLSLKDMCTIEYIPELLEAGIDSFKIEGRMKKPEYAAELRQFIANILTGIMRIPKLLRRFLRQICIRFPASIFAVRDRMVIITSTTAGRW